MESAISVNDLFVSYKNKKGQKVEAVRGLSFEVGKGEVVGFLGPNGAGKSSTLKALMGFIEPDSGSISVFGKAHGTAASRSRIGYLPEVALYYPYLTPLETLRLYGELQGLRGKSLRKESEYLLEMVGLNQAMKKQNRQMSKGMLQRVGIAQSMLGNPELLVLDEVTSGLDPVGRKELRDMLKQKQKQYGTTLFFSSHELAEVEMLCDRILLIHQGKFIEERNVTALKDELRHYEIKFRGDINLIGLAETFTLLGEDVIRATFETKPQLMLAIEKVQSSSSELIDIVATEGSLEDYFIDTIKRAA